MEAYNLSQGYSWWLMFERDHGNFLIDTILATNPREAAEVNLTWPEVPGNSRYVRISKKRLEVGPQPRL